MLLATLNTSATFVIGQTNHNDCVWIVLLWLRSSFVGNKNEIKWLQVTVNFHCILVCDMLAGSSQQRKQWALQQGKRDRVKTPVRVKLCPYFSPCLVDRVGSRSVCKTSPHQVFLHSPVPPQSHPSPSSYSFSCSMKSFGYQLPAPYSGIVLPCSPFYTCGIHTAQMFENRLLMSCTCSLHLTTCDKLK